MKLRDFSATVIDIITARDDYPHYPLQGTVLDSGWYGVDPGNGVIDYGMGDDLDD